VTSLGYNYSLNNESRLWARGAINSRNHPGELNILVQLTEMGILKEAVVGKVHLFANHKLLRVLSK